MKDYFSGTENYVATDELALAVNAAITLERPLLIKGEPGTGKTMLAEEVANSLGKSLIRWHVKSTTKAQQGLYEYDAVTRLRDSQLGDKRVKDVKNYIKKGKPEKGKRMTFLLQEFLREINTIGSKANNSEIQSKVVEMKTSLEKIREQVLNIV